MTTFEQVPEPVQKKGTDTTCSFCDKTFAPDYAPSRTIRHLIFNVRTKYATYTGPTHGSCLEILRSLQLPGVTKEAF